MAAKENYRTVQRTARSDVREKLKLAGRLDLWGKIITPDLQLVVRTATACGFNRTDTKKLVILFEETLAVRAL